MTNSIKYSLGVLALLFLLFLYNNSSQDSYKMVSQSIFEGSADNVFRIKLFEDSKEIELIRKDSTWSISNVDTLVIKENQIKKIFDRLLKVEKEILITSKEEKWEKFGVDDSLARRITVYDENDNEMLHYLFGNSGQDWQHNYIRKHGSSDVYRTNDNVFFLLNTNSTYWGEKPPEPKPIVNSDSTANIDAQ